MIIHGGYEGGLDGIDVWGDNIWIHDIEVSNKDECVTVKDPSSNLLIEQVHCNWSGGCAMGSLSSGIGMSLLSLPLDLASWSLIGSSTNRVVRTLDISNIEYNYIYTHHSNQMYMIKSNGGDGTVTGLSFNNFMGHSNAYTLDFDTAWSSMDTADGDGISYSNISFSGWSGSCADGTERGPVKINCPADNVCTDITVEDFSVWTDSGDSVYYGCQNAYGEGACLQSGDSGAYTTTQTITTGSASYSTMDNELTTGYDISSSIPIPSMPASFYPGRQPISAILSGSASEATESAAASGSSSSGSVAAAAGYAASSSSSTLATAYTAAAQVTTTTAAAAATTQMTADSWDQGGRGSGWGQGGGSFGNQNFRGSAKLRRHN